MKVIFLDFDGVITTEKSGYKLDKEKMEFVKSICDKTGAKIVISSSWRLSTLESTISNITTVRNPDTDIPFLMPELVIGVTKRMYAFSHDDAGKHYRIPRGVEIERYLMEHEEVDRYVVLDDDDDMLLCQAPYFVKTDTRLGLTEYGMNKAIEILNGDE